jgi:hypothetical protein
VTSFLVLFGKTFVFGKYDVLLTTDCDPTTEVCFVRECTPDDPENNPCSTPDVPKEYFRLVNLEAHLIPECTEANDSCRQVTCTPDMGTECLSLVCDEKNFPEGSEGWSCIDPATYQEEATAVPEATENDNVEGLEPIAAEPDADKSSSASGTDTPADELA